MCFMSRTLLPTQFHIHREFYDFKATKKKCEEEIKLRNLHNVERWLPSLSFLVFLSLSLFLSRVGYLTSVLRGFYPLSSCISIKWPMLRCQNLFVSTHNCSRRVWGSFFPTHFTLDAFLFTNVQFFLCFFFHLRHRLQFISFILVSHSLQPKAHIFLLKKLFPFSVCVCLCFFALLYMLLFSLQPMFSL